MGGSFKLRVGGMGGSFKLRVGGREGASNSGWEEGRELQTLAGFLFRFCPTESLNSSLILAQALNPDTHMQVELHGNQITEHCGYIPFPQSDATYA